MRFSVAEMRAAWRRGGLASESNARGLPDLKVGWSIQLGRRGDAGADESMIGDRHREDATNRRAADPTVVAEFDKWWINGEPLLVTDSCRLMSMNNEEKRMLSAREAAIDRCERRTVIRPGRAATQRNRRAPACPEHLQIVRAGFAAADASALLRFFDVFSPGTPTARHEASASDDDDALLASSSYNASSNVSSSAASSSSSSSSPRCAWAAARVKVGEGASTTRTDVDVVAVVNSAARVGALTTARYSKYVEYVHATRTGAGVGWDRYLDSHFGLALEDGRLLDSQVERAFFLFVLFCFVLFWLDGRLLATRRSSVADRARLTDSHRALVVALRDQISPRVRQIE